MMRTARPGPGNGWRQTISSGRPSSSPTARTSSLNRCAQRLDELEVHVVGQTADVVVALDVRVVAAAGLDDVGIERALHEEARVAEILRGLLEHADEELADDLALALRIDDVVERVEEPVLRLHVHEVDLELVAERVCSTCSASPSRSSPVSTKTHDELVADRLVHERGRDRGVDAARQTADHALGADLGADLGDRVLDDRDVRPRGPAARGVEQERLQDLHAVLGVRDLGVELHRVDARGRDLRTPRPAVRVGARGDREARRAPR